MEMIIGRQGEQKMTITERTVSRKHCKVVLLEDGNVAVENLSPNGTFFDGIRKEQAVVSIDSEIGLGPYFKAKLSDLMGPLKTKVSKPVGVKKSTSPKPAFDLNAARKYTHFKQVVRDYKRLADLEAFSAAVDASADGLPAYVPFVVRSGLAYKYLKNGKIGKAQKLLYDTGDGLYDVLERTPEMEGSYASMMALLSEVYQAMYKYDAAETAGRYAVGIYNRWKPGDPGITFGMVADAYAVYADALAVNEKNEQAARCYDRALELYKKIGPEDVAYYSAVISETENKQKNVSGKV